MVNDKENAVYEKYKNFHTHSGNKKLLLKQLEYDLLRLDDIKSPKLYGLVASIFGYESNFFVMLVTQQAYVSFLPIEIALINYN